MATIGITVCPKCGSTNTYTGLTKVDCFDCEGTGAKAGEVYNGSDITPELMKGKMMVWVRDPVGQYYKVLRWWFSNDLAIVELPTFGTFTMDPDWKVLVGEEDEEDITF